VAASFALNWPNDADSLALIVVVFALKSLNIKIPQTGTVEITQKVWRSVTALASGWVSRVQIR